MVVVLGERKGRDTGSRSVEKMDSEKEDSIDEIAGTHDGKRTWYSEEMHGSVPN